MKHLWRLTVLLLAVMATNGACAQNKSKHKATAQVVKPVLSPSDSHRFGYFYMEAIRQEQLGNFAAAFDLLGHCLEINPTSAETYFTLSTYYNEIGDHDKALSCMEKAAALSPSNNHYVERLAQTLIRTGDYEKAQKTYEQLSSAAPARTDVLSILMQLYQYNDDYDGMMRVLNRLELIEGPSEDITLSRMQIYSRQGKKKEEYRELRELARQYPNDYNYRVMMGNWLLQNGKKKEALAEYNHVLRKEPDNIMAQMSLLDYYKAEGNESLAQEMTERLLLSDNTETESKITLLKQLIADSESEDGDSTAILATFDKMLDVPKPDPGIAELCAAYMQLKHMPDSSVNQAMERVLRIAPDNAGVRIQLLQSVWKSEDYDRIISLCQPALEYNPDNMAFYYFMGLAHYQKGQKDKTLDILRRGVSQINSESNPAIVSDFYEIMGDILHEKGYDNEAFAAYDSCLTWKADNIGCLNNYAYYLSEKGLDLQKAEQMSYRTVKAEPNSATYLDTYAWILFKQGRYEEARIYIDQAVRNDSAHSSVITEHAGDIYMMNNDAERALEYWRKALEAGSDHSALIERKIKLKKYTEE